MRKRYIILLIIILILLTFVFIFFRGTKNEEIFLNEVSENNIEETPERASQGYKITDDFVLVNIPQAENLEGDVEE